jgi:hypothetical protein
LAKDLIKGLEKIKDSDKNPLLKSGYQKGKIDDDTGDAIKAFCTTEGITYPGYVNAEIWEALGLGFTYTLSQEFFGKDKKNYNDGWFFDVVLAEHNIINSDSV